MLRVDALGTDTTRDSAAYPAIGCISLCLSPKHLTFNKRRFSRAILASWSRTEPVDGVSLAEWQRLSLPT